MALTAINIAICIIAIARKKRPGLIGGGAPIGWTVLTPISSQSVITLADAVTVGAPASTTTSTSSPRCCIMKSSLFYLRNYSETVGASFLVSKPGYLQLSRAKRSLPPALRFPCTWFVPLRSSSQAPFGYAHSSKRRFFSLSWAHQLDEAHFLGRRCDTDHTSRR